MPDRDFLEEIQKTEQEAEDRLEKAREEGQLQRQMARQQAADIVDAAYRAATVLRQNKMEEADEAYRRLLEDRSSLTVPKASDLPPRIKEEAAALIAERILDLLEHR